jgi:hypothetical protein
MRVINAKPDKYLIECIELDLYDLLYKNMTNQLSNSLVTEAADLLDKYRLSNAIRDFNVVETKPNYIKVEVFTPRKIEIICQIP